MKMQNDQKDAQRTQTEDHPPKPEHFRAAATQDDNDNYSVIDRVRHISQKRQIGTIILGKEMCTCSPNFT